jgi:hypothetical protein
VAPTKKKQNKKTQGSPDSLSCCFPASVQAQDAKGKMEKFNYSTATVPEVIQAFKDGADANVEMVYTFVQYAKSIGVKTAGYESGPGYSVGGEHPGSKGLNTLIEASRDPGMKTVIEYDVRETCWRQCVTLLSFAVCACVCV